jgi:hypothetical protein
LSLFSTIPVPNPPFTFLGVPTDDIHLNEQEEEKGDRKPGIIRGKKEHPWNFPLFLKIYDSLHRLKKIPSNLLFSVTVTIDKNKIIELEDYTVMPCFFLLFCLQYR